MKCSREMLPYLPYFCNTKTHVVFSFFISCYLIFPPNECRGLCQHRPGHSLGPRNWKGLLKCRIVSNYQSIFYFYSNHLLVVCNNYVDHETIFNFMTAARHPYNFLFQSRTQVRLKSDQKKITIVVLFSDRPSTCLRT